MGWLVLRGRCRNCGARISVLYPALEAVTAALFVAPFVVFDDLWVGALIAALLSLMPAITVIDVQHRIIPNRLMYPALIAFPVYVLIASVAGGDVDPIRAAIGFASFGGGLFLVAAVSGGMGMGDVKLAGLEGVALGALGLRYVGVAAAAAILLGGLGGIVALLLGRGRRSAIPFGPYLAAGAVVAAFWGGSIAGSYLDTFS